MTPDDLRRAQADETAARVLEEELARLDPRTPWTRTLGVDLPTRDEFPDDAAYRAELASRRRQWLEGRFEALTAAARFREEAARAARLGVSRFLPPGTTLDDLAAETASDDDSLRELHHERFEERRARRAAALEEATR
jgi:hypothetical protein